MSTLTPEQIAGYAKGAGFSGDALVVATAVGLAESSGRTDVVNSIGCVGVWQINQPVHIRDHPTWTREWLKNPANNAQAAYVLSNGGRNWRPWEVYTNGMYAAQMGRARIAAARPAGSSATPIGTGTNASSTTATYAGFGDLLEDLGNLAKSGGLSLFFGEGQNPLDTGKDIGQGLLAIAKGVLSLVIMGISAAKWLSDPHNWLRIVQVAGGGVAVFIGLKMLASANAGPASAIAAGAVKPIKAVAGKAKTVAKSAAKTPGKATATAAKSTAKTAATAAKSAAKTAGKAAA